MFILAGYKVNMDLNVGETTNFKREIKFKSGITYKLE